MSRISRGDMLFEIARSVSKRSTCLRKQIGAVVARNGRVLTLGYNGAPSGTPHCTDVGCLIDPQTGACIRTVHAEASAISWAAREGIALKDACMYTTISPCMPCAQLIINSGILKVFYLEKYRDERPLKYLGDASIEVIHVAPKP